MQIYDWAGWSKWTSFDELAANKFAGVIQTAGNYAIRTNKKGGIHRVSGTDDLGLLYVGESDRLRSRIYDFWDCIVHNGKDTHVAGWRYNLVWMPECAPPDTLAVSWIKAADKEGAVQVELDMLLWYVLNHCELPPLNYKFGEKLADRVVEHWKLNPD